MTAILPTRISLYDFLIEDLAPIDPIIADSGHISIPQAYILRHGAIQAVVSALLTYEQKHGANSVLKKLFNRQAVKELREYNAFNFTTMQSVLQYSITIEALFRNQKTLKSTCSILADQANTSSSKAHTVLSAVGLIALRELAIVADFAHLDDADLSKWFGYQHQFMQLDRAKLTSEETALPTLKVLDNFDTQWHEVMGYRAPQPFITNKDYPRDNTTPNYAKAIGLVPNSAANLKNNHKEVTSDNYQAHHNNAVTFITLPNINLPHSRWLLQLGRVADIYLSREHLRIAPEPVTPPPPPLLNLGLYSTLAEDETITDRDSPIIYDAPKPIWKDKTIYITLAVIGVLGLLSLLKFQYKALPSGTPVTALNTSSELAREPSYDIAVMRVQEDETINGQSGIKGTATSAISANNNTPIEASDPLSDNRRDNTSNTLAYATNSDEDMYTQDGTLDSNTDTLNIITTTHINLISAADEPISSKPKAVNSDQNSDQKDEVLPANSTQKSNTKISETTTVKTQQQHTTTKSDTNDNNTAVKSTTSPSDTTPNTATNNNSTNKQTSVDISNSDDAIINASDSANANKAVSSDTAANRSASKPTTVTAVSTKKPTQSDADTEDKPTTKAKANTNNKDENPADSTTTDSDKSPKEQTVVPNNSGVDSTDDNNADTTKKEDTKQTVTDNSNTDINDDYIE